MRKALRNLQVRVGRWPGGWGPLGRVAVRNALGQLRVRCRACGASLCMRLHVGVGGWSGGWGLQVKWPGARPRSSCRWVRVGAG